MYEPKLLARLDSIKHHLMSGMATPYVIDEIECLQRDLEKEMRATSRPRDYARYHPEIQWSGEFSQIKDIRLIDVSWDPHDVHSSSDDLEQYLKIDETQLRPEYVEGPQPTWVTSLKIPKNPNYGDKPLKTIAGSDLR